MTDESGAERPAEPSGTGSGTLHLEIDLREDGASERLIFAPPSPREVTAALGSLDQRRHTELTVVDPAGGYIVVGGGSGQWRGRP